MSFDLTSETGEKLALRTNVWTFVLNVAMEYGWSGAGTLPPRGVPPANWPGRYDTNDGQAVTRPDATALAAALDRAAADPALDAVSQRVARSLAAHVMAEFKKVTGEDLPERDLLERYSCDPATLGLISEFLKKGSFRIN